MWVLLTKAYTSIPPEKAAEYLGLSKDVVVPGMFMYKWMLIVVLLQEKWTYDAEKNLLMPGEVVLRMASFIVSLINRKEDCGPASRICGFCEIDRDCYAIEE